MTTTENTNGPIFDYSGVQKNSLVMFVLMIVLLSLFNTRMRSETIYKPKYDSLTCLEIEGKIVNPDVRPGTTCTVELVGNNGQIDTLVLNNKSKFKFLLNKDSYYVIRISMTGYISKLVSVNTELSGEMDNLYRFMFETSLLKEHAVVHLNKEVTDMPIAIIYFNHDGNCFVYNKKYTNTIKKEMRKTKSFNNQAPQINTNSKALATAYTD